MRLHVLHVILDKLLTVLRNKKIFSHFSGAGSVSRKNIPGAALKQAGFETLRQMAICFGASERDLTGLRFELSE